MNDFKKAVGKDFDKLPKIIQTHYNLDPSKEPEVVVEGYVDEIFHNWYGGIFTFFGMFFNALVPYQGKHIKVRLTNELDKDGAMLWERHFYFEGKKPYYFNSKMVYRSDHRVVEYIRFGLGLDVRLELNEKYLKYNLDGYLLNVFGLKIPIPSFFVLGKGFIMVEQVSDSEFSMNFQLKHPVFGKTFGFKGKFKVTPIYK